MFKKSNADKGVSKTTNSHSLKKIELVWMSKDGWLESDTTNTRTIQLLDHK